MKYILFILLLFYSSNGICQTDTVVEIPIWYIRHANKVFVHDDYMTDLHIQDSIQIRSYEQLVTAYEQKDSARVEQLDQCKSQV